jgi:hypothetical protein
MSQELQAKLDKASLALQPILWELLADIEGDNNE